MLMLRTRSDFSVQVVESVICIADLDMGRRSVANDAENVIQALVEHGFNLQKHPVIYRDASGVWDCLRVNAKNIFAGFFALGNITDRQEAIDRIKSLNGVLAA
jgi:hypothetical protein